MGTDFMNSETKVNLMRAFAGESQARNRYTFAADKMKKQNLQVLEQVFLFTAGQEKEHAEIFYNHLKDLAGETILMEGGYPVDPSDTAAQLPRSAQSNEYEEWETVYQAFGDKAVEEGFLPVATSFYRIAEIEKTHGDRFGMFADLLESGKLFAADEPTRWMCLNCGHIHTGMDAPEICPVCHHPQGYFIRVEQAPYTD
ncbi:MAG: rubrerythrin [Anaerovoracaceae bacterium]